MVVFHHLSLTFRPFSDVFIVPGAAHPAAGSATWWLTSTPAELLIAGPEAVLVFFVLSGLVLTLPVLRRGSQFDWFGYYPQRVVRLYLPSMVSIVLGAVLAAAVLWTTTTSSSLWVEEFRFRAVDPAKIVSGWDLLFGDISLNNPLWTLRWEVAFSLLLPVVIAIAIRLRRRWLFVVIGCVIVVAIGNVTGVGSLQFLPIFLIGAMMAVHYDAMLTWSAAAENAGRVRWGGLGVLVISLLLVNVHWTFWGAFGALRLQPALLALEVIGGAGLVLVAAFWPPARALLDARLFRWLGRVSFSLYLVHVPVIIALDALFGSAAPVLRVVVSLVVALLMAELFSRVVEQPAHRLAKRVGAASSALLQRASTH